MIIPFARVALLCAFLASAAAAFMDGQWYSVVCNAGLRAATPGSHNCRLVEGEVEGALATGKYSNDVMQDGWGKLFIRSSDVARNEQWWAAGYLEGAFTSLQIWQHFQGWFDFTFGADPMTEELQAFIIEQYKFAKQLAEENKKSGDPYYQRLGAVLAQVEGMYAGMIRYGTEDYVLNFFQLLLLNAAGDVYDIVPATNPTSVRKWSELSSFEFTERFHRMVSCSALIKISDDLKDVFAGHTTWTSYQNMLRVWKAYEFGEYKVSFSAKPGVIYSKDDFYVVGAEHQRLVVMETTNGVLNDELYKLITPKSLLTWQRIPMVNSLATGGEEWTTMYKKYNSGTYNNQYMVVDMKKFVPGEGAKPGFLWIIEQIPGMAPSADVTDVMVAQDNHWPSYNVPYFPEVYKASGFEDAYEQHGDEYSYSECTRAKIFARDQSKVQSLAAFESIIRYDDYQNDPLSNGDPGAAISPRHDLRTTNAKAFGGIDGKVSSYTLIQENKARAQSGPTFDQQPVFKWSDWPDAVNPGMPEQYDFPWIDVPFGF